MTQSQPGWQKSDDKRRFKSASLRAVGLLLIIFVLLESGCTTTRSTRPTNSGLPPTTQKSDPSGADTTAKPTKKASGANQPPTNRAQAAVEGAMVGAVVGGQLGPIGAAVGAGTMLIYGAITGQVPFGKPGSGGARPGRSPAESRREQDIEAELESEINRQDNLEGQIENELEKQEALLKEIDRKEQTDQAVSLPPPHSAQGSDPLLKGNPGNQTTALQTSDPNRPEQEIQKLETTVEERATPSLPIQRELPIAIFEKERQVIPAGRWNNEQPLQVSVRTLDADEDGTAEELRYYSEEDGTLLRKELDRDYDGSIDTWIEYKKGKISRILLDENRDKEPDEWQTYLSSGQMVVREVDRNHDGRKDAFFYYQGDSLIREEHDLNTDGQIDRVSYFENRVLERAEEDLDGDGVMDTWVLYGREGAGPEFIRRVEKDTNTDGRRDTFEDYEKIGESVFLKKRREDKNADGKIDVTSLYEKGKLTRKEISDPDLVPL